MQLARRQRPPHIATTILDRFLHHAQVIAITGRSYRLKDRAVKQAGTKHAGKEDPPAKEKRSGKEEAPCGKDA